MGIPFVEHDPVPDAECLERVSLFRVMHSIGTVFAEEGSFRITDSYAEQISETVNDSLADEVMGFLRMPFTAAELAACNEWLAGVAEGPEGASDAGLESAFRALRFGVFYNNNGIFVSGWFPPRADADPLVLRLAVYRQPYSEGGDGRFECTVMFR